MYSTLIGLMFAANINII